MQVEASRDAPSFEDPGNPTFSTKVLLGKDEVRHITSTSTKGLNHNDTFCWEIKYMSQKLTIVRSNSIFATR